MLKYVLKYEKKNLLMQIKVVVRLLSADVCSIQVSMESLARKSKLEQAEPTEHCTENSFMQWLQKYRKRQEMTVIQ